MYKNVIFFELDCFATEGPRYILVFMSFVVVLLRYHMEGKLRRIGC